MPRDAVLLKISLDDEEASPEELERHTYQLRDEIADLAVEQVGLAPAGAPAPGAKGDPITIGTVIVTLAWVGVVGVFTSLIELCKAWAQRNERRTVTLRATVGEREVELVYCPSLDKPEKMARFFDTVVGIMREGSAPKQGG